MDAWISPLLHWLAVPDNSLLAVFVVATLSATLLPMGSEPAVLGVVYVNPHLFWPTIAVATVGNTLGGAFNWWLGYQAQSVRRKHLPPMQKNQELRALRWLQRLGPKACLLAWLPLVGDPLCTVAGWLRLPWWPCVVYMAIGKALRYVVMTALGLGLIGG
ncbi:DedA family protein [Curvibacter sp. CHRR-16]|uniref:YqaA family protein n=1 Tax=Curvibacter sp. CHRR-16 TaxID=2835872 RepID=UPI001BDA437D|nr:YqaA family protein [Curvibacter sp. CHRR-16]MBT0571406.1 DedA family protein [Curvibacter sp. CHRR-16]